MITDRNDDRWTPEVREVIFAGLREEHDEIMAAIKEEYAVKRRVYRRNYYRRNSKKILQYNSEYRKKLDPDKRYEYARRYYERHPDRVKLDRDIRRHPEKDEIIKAVMLEREEALAAGLNMPGLQQSDSRR